jgi:hypothetical protein
MKRLPFRCCALKRIPTVSFALYRAGLIVPFNATRTARRGAFRVSSGTPEKPAGYGEPAPDIAALAAAYAFGLSRGAP